MIAKMLNLGYGNQQLAGQCHDYLLADTYWPANCALPEPSGQFTIRLGLQEPQQTPTGQQVVVRQDARPSDEVATIARHVNVHVGAYRQRL